MAPHDDAIESMRDAVRAAPDNPALRQALGDLLLSAGRADEAEREFRAGLQKSPDNARLKLGLAAAFARQGKNSPALVIVEELLKLADPPGRAYVLHARLLLRTGESDRAARQYRRGIELDPAAADEALAGELGLGDADLPPEDAVREPVQEGGPGPLVRPERPAVSFADVGGMDDLKEQIRLKIIHPLNHPEIYKAYGKSAGGGILMYGPPGCGKTHLARATAGEVKARFVSVGIHDVLNMWIGESEKNLHEIFETARRSKPCVLFFDEVDALGANRADMRHSGGRHTINQFLDELDGVKASNDGVLVLGATNAPWHLDSAFRRPGRFDRILFVPPPDAGARAAILRILLKGKPAPDADPDLVARKTEGFSGADLKAVVDSAVEAKLQQAMKQGALVPLSTKDLLAAAGTLRPTTREWFATARNYALYSNQGGVYDDILKYLKL